LVPDPQQLYPWLDDPSCDVSNEDNYDPVEDDPMDGDHETGLASAGFGRDEDYGFYGDDE